MDTIKAAAASVTGARHLRAARNGQDAAVAWVGSTATGSAVGVVVVCDGCSSGASSEVGARLGASLFGNAVAMRLRAGELPTEPALWEAARTETVRALSELVERMAGDRAAAVHDHFLFTIVAAAVTRGEAATSAAVWALGDGAYSFGDRTRVLGPFDDNAPPYLAYDLVGEPRAASFEVAPASCAALVVATDGASDLDMPLETFTATKLVEHPDGLRRHLTLLARSHERVVWDDRRVARTPARLQDDCAVAVLRWSVS